MIIACSANALARIRQARFNRAAKADGRPLIVDGKVERAEVRAALGAHADAPAFVWNLDFAEAPVVSGEEAIGTVVTGYLYQHEAQFTVVLNSLDEGDLCRIGAVARNAIRIALSDICVCPQATESYLEQADGLGAEVAESCGMRFAYPYEAPADKTLVVANANRSAASGLTRARTFHEMFLYGGSGASVSHEPVDRYACYRLNERAVEFKQPDGLKLRSRPFQRMRQMLRRFSDDEPIAAVELKFALVDDRFLYREHPDVKPSAVPECWRTVLVPIDAPLSWVHRVIQKSFNWYDYHLHRFSFLNFEAREAFEELFGVECGIERFGEEPLVMRQAAYEASGGRERFKRLTGLDDKWLMRGFAPYAEAELIHEDYPLAALPEDMPVGLALFGSARYEAVMGIDHLERDEDRRRILRDYYASLREAMAKKAAKAAGVQGSEAGLASGAAVDPLATLDPACAHALYYNYDFGDDWGLSVEAVGVRLATPGDMPRVLGGAGHTPPEDCGGIGGFKRVLAAYELTDGRRESAQADDGEAAGPEAIAEAEDLMSWAQGAVGWRPFAGEADLAETFDRPGRM